MPAPWAPGARLAPAIFMLPTRLFPTFFGFALVTSASVAHAEPSWPYRDGQIVPPGYHVEAKPDTTLLVLGSLDLGLGYGLGVAVAAEAKFANKSGYMLVPVAGPWITYAVRTPECPGSQENDNCLIAPLVTAGFVLDGLAQGLGAAVVVMQLAFPSKRLVPNTAFVPYAARDGAGLTVVGRF